MPSTAAAPWGEEEKNAWFQAQTIQRSYKQDVEQRIFKLDAKAFNIVNYGEIFVDTPKEALTYELYAIKSHAWNAANPIVLITGGVHGYETSGVMGALEFVEKNLKNYSDTFNFIVAPCVSPWSYETINRWNPGTENPNREFKENGQSREAALLMHYIKGQNIDVDMHIDLHETTDTDKTRFRLEKAAKEGAPYDATFEHIPNGFYLVVPADHPKTEFEAAIIEGVEKVTHIAPPDADGKIIGEPLIHKGVIAYREDMGLCMNFTGAAGKLGAVTTEIYPDSPGMTAEECNKGQIAVITSALDYTLARS